MASVSSMLALLPNARRPSISLHDCIKAQLPVLDLVAVLNALYTTSGMEQPFLFHVRPLTTQTDASWLSLLFLLVT